MSKGIKNDVLNNSENKSLFIATSANLKRTTPAAAIEKLITHLNSKYKLHPNQLKFTHEGFRQYCIEFPPELFGGLTDELMNHLLFLELLPEELRTSFEVEQGGFSHAPNTEKLTSKFEVFPQEEAIMAFSAIKAKKLEVITKSREFLRTVFDEKAEGFINIRMLGGKGKSINEYAETIDEAIYRAHTHNGSKNVYYGLALRKTKENGTKNNCSSLSVIYADIDYGTAGHKTKPSFAAEDEARSVINGCELKPTIITHSGHGFQVMWKLKETLILSEENVIRVENLMRKVNNKLCGDPTQNVDRIFRLPYTLNIKADPFVEATILEMTPEREYSLEELEDWIGVEEEDISKITPKVKTAPVVSKYKGFEVKKDLLPFENFENVKKNCQWVQNIYRKSEEEHHLLHNDRYKLASLLCRFELGAGEIHKVMSNCSDYNKDFTDSQINQIMGNGYLPPLCETLCSEKCELMLKRGKISPIAFAFSAKENKDEENSNLPVSFTIRNNSYHKYIKSGKGFHESMVTSFIIDPKELLVLDNGDCLKCDIITCNGVTYPNIQIENKDWLSKQKFLSAIGHMDCTFHGSDNDLQALCQFITTRIPIRKNGVKSIGLHEDVWVTEGINITKTGLQEDIKIIPYQKGNDAFSHKIQYQGDMSKQLPLFFENIVKINEPAVIMPYIGWVFASPLKSKIMEKMGSFPVLFNHGGQGGGKSSTARVFARICGYKDPTPYSVTMKSFPILKLLSSTNGIPQWYDEFKVSDMRKEDVDNTLRYMRKIYSGEVESKGRPDQTIENYNLSAPMAVMGEWNINQPAIMERVIIIRSSGKIKGDKQMQDAFNKLNNLDLEGFMPSFIQFCLNQKIECFIEEAEKVVEITLKNITVAPRIKNNLIVMLIGIMLFMEYGRSNGIKPPAPDYNLLLKTQLKELTGSSSGIVKSAVDQMIEELGIMAERGDIIEGTDFKVVNKQNSIALLAIRFNKIFPTFVTHTTRTGYEGDRLDKSSYNRLFDETEYICTKNTNAKFNNQSHKCLMIDIKKAKNAGINLDGFIPQT